MTTQQNQGAMLRDQGINKAIDHANRIEDSWSDIAFTFLRSYMINHRMFMIEEVREASKGIVPEPPSTRAWGGIVVKAVKQGLITRVGFKNVKNAKAHCTPASLWMSLI